MVQTDLALTIDGVRVGATKAADKRVDSTNGGWTTTFDGDVIVQNSQDGSFAVLNRFGSTFGISARRGDESYDLNGVVKDLHDGTMEFDGTIKHNGAVISKPSLVVFDGKQAAVHVGGNPAMVLPSVSASPTEPGVVKVGDSQTQGIKLDLTLRKVADTAPSENLSYRRMYPPKYPREALRDHISGKVVLKVAVDEHGVPISAEVYSVTPEDSAHGLADAAIATAMQWRYNPGVKYGKPVGGELLVPVDFTLLGDDGDKLTPTISDAAKGVGVSYRKMRPPVYPQEAIAAKIAGTLYLRAHIDANGDVSDAYVDQAVPVSALGLKETAIAALKSWQFNPATQNGRPVESEALVPMRFRIEGDATSTPAAPEPAYPDTVRKLEAVVVTGAAN